VNETLISITDKVIGNKTVNAVNARDLHAFLEVGKDFSNWIKAQGERRIRSGWKKSA